MRGAAIFGALIAELAAIPVSPPDLAPLQRRRRFALPAGPLHSDAIDPLTVSPRPWRTWPGCQTRSQRRAGRST